MTDKDIYKRFGKMISEMRMKLGYSQEEVANRLGLPKSTYGNYERGERKIPLPDLITMSKFYGFSIDDFINGEKDILWTQLFASLWKERFEGIKLTRDEMIEILNFTEYLLSKRNDK